MKGMSTGLEANDQTVVSAFHSALAQPGFVDPRDPRADGHRLGPPARAFRLSRGRRPSQADAPASSSRFRVPRARGAAAAADLLRPAVDLRRAPAGPAEDAARHGAPRDPAAAAASPAWVQHLENALATIWSYHPVAAAAAAVWIQVGIGVWLLARRGGTGRGWRGWRASCWGLIVWVFGEAFGGIFAPGLTWLFGRPERVLFYCFAGVLDRLRESAWTTPRLGRIGPRGDGPVLHRHGRAAGVARARLLAGRASAGCRSGDAHGDGQGNVADAATGLSRSWVASFGDSIATHGWEVNLFARDRPRGDRRRLPDGPARSSASAVIAGLVLCLADWVLDRGLRLLRRRRHRPEQHDPDGPRVHRWLPGDRRELP